MIKYSAPHSIEFEIPLFRVQLRRKTRVKIIKINKKLKIFIYLTTWFTCQERSFNPKSRCGYMEVVDEFRGVLLTLCCHQLFRNGEESNVEDSRDLTGAPVSRCRGNKMHCFVFVHQLLWLGP